jgi:uncharacterized membrane protein
MDPRGQQPRRWIELSRESNGWSSVIQHRNSIVIDAPLSEVFAYVNDPRSLCEWTVSMSETRNVIGEGEGQQYEWSIKLVGVPLHGQAVIVEYVQNQRAVHQGIGMFEMLWTNLVEPDNGGTKLTMELEYAIPVPVLGKLAEHLMVRRNERNLQSALLNLKDKLEG